MQLYVTTFRPDEGDYRVLGVRNTLDEAQGLAVQHFTDENEKLGLLRTAMYQGDTWTEVEDGRLWVSRYVDNYAVSLHAVPTSPSPDPVREANRAAARLRRRPRLGGAP
jgi:hypothetical protein